MLCLVGLRWTSLQLLQVGLVLQIGAAACIIAASLLGIVGMYTQFTPNLTVLEALDTLFGLLNLTSLIYLSYGLAHWQASDRRWLVVQLLLATALGIAAVVALHAIFVRTDQTAPEVVCSVAAALALLARPACWQAHSLITVCLGMGALGPLSYVILFVHPNPGLTVDVLHLYFALSLGAILLTLLGILLLVRTEHTAAAHRAPSTT